MSQSMSFEVNMCFANVIMIKTKPCIEDKS